MSDQHIITCKSCGNVFNVEVASRACPCCDAEHIIVDRTMAGLQWGLKNE